MTARDIMRELQALGARLERAGDRLILRAGSHPIPQSLVDRAREAKRGILALLDPAVAPRPPSGEAVSPTSQEPVAVLANPSPQSRRNADVLLRPPVGGLSGGLRESPATLAALGDDTMAPEPEELCGFHEINHLNLSVSGVVTPQSSKTPRRPTRWRS